MKNRGLSRRTRLSVRPRRIANTNPGEVTSETEGGEERVNGTKSMKSMADSNCDDCGSIDVDWVFYKDRPEWSDMEGVLQSDGPFPVVRIAYSEKFADIFNYFRAVLHENEISERALGLTKDAISVNASSYNVWHYRRILLKSLDKDIYEELKFCEEVIESNPKNYQVWHHRQVLAEWLHDGSHEKHLTEKVLSADAKNYHAWQHRQWVIQKFDLWYGELEYVNKLLEEDIRNNSAWNQRYFVISHTSKFTSEVLQREIKYTLDSVKKVPHNESAWNYLRGILQDQGLMRFPMVYEFCEKLHKDGCTSSYLLAFLIDCIEEKLLAAGDSQDPSLCQKVLDLCASLASEHDVIRKEYWNYIARNLGDMYGPEEAHSHPKLDEETNVKD